MSFFNSKSMITVIFFAVLASVYHQGANAQDLSGLPTCGQNCLITAFTSASDGCSQTDFSCLCKSQKFTLASVGCYNSSCPATDAATATKWGVKTCASVGVNATATVANTTATGTVIGNGTHPSATNASVAATNAQNSGAYSNVASVVSLAAIIGSASALLC